MKIKVGQRFVKRQFRPSDDPYCFNVTVHRLNDGKVYAKVRTYRGENDLRTAIWANEVFDRLFRPESRPSLIWSALNQS